MMDKTRPYSPGLFHNDVSYDIEIDCSNHYHSVGIFHILHLIHSGRGTCNRYLEKNPN